MKILSTLSVIVFALGIQVSEAQNKKDSTNKQTDTLNKSTGTILPIISREIKVVKEAVPQFSKSEAKTGVAKNNTLGTPVEKPPVDPVDPGDPPTGPGSSGASEAGRTTTSIDVSPSGGSVFNIPFFLPPGLGNAVPQLGLSYNAQSGNGSAGFGWNITGLSSITRLSTTIFHDNKIRGINFDADDRFALDGQRLLLKSGNYGADGAEYQTEVYSNIRIFSRGVSPYGASFGPEYFEVLYPDGSKAFYGSSTNSRTQTQYSITYSENAIGARINYSYNQSNNVLYISQVSFGALGNASPINQVNFSYAYATRAETAYVGGLAFYWDQILTKVSVIANGNNFRNYKITHNAITPLNYQRIASVQEFDGNETKSFMPINFTYGATGDILSTTLVSNLGLSGLASNNSDIVTADFTGDGSMDFLVYPKGVKDKFWTFFDLDTNPQSFNMGYQINTGVFKDIFPVTWLTHNEKIISGQGIAVAKDNGPGSVKFTVYSSGTTAPVYYQYDKIWNDLPRYPGYHSGCDNQYHEGEFADMDFVSGDFNGDGLSDVIAIGKSTSVVVYEYMDPNGGGDTDWRQPAPWEEELLVSTMGGCIQQYAESGSQATFVNLDRRLSSDYITPLGGLYPFYQTGEKLYSGDFNGDGKTDFVHIKNGAMYVYTLNSNQMLEQLWQKIDTRIVLGQVILLGDYNGDGKTDVMFSTGNNSLFTTFMSTGKGFEKQEKYQPFTNTPATWDGTGPGTLNLYYLLANDVDGDGKTDIISAQTTTYNSSSLGTLYVSVYNNSGASYDLQPNFTLSVSSNWRRANLRHYAIPIFLNPTRPNFRLEFGFLSDNSVNLFKFNRDVKAETQLQAVEQDGVIYTIEYKQLVGNQGYTDIPIYQAGYEQTYPYVDLENIPGMSFVSKINRYFGSGVVIQVFGYGKAVSHAQGLGFLGFGEVIRSNWHVNSSDNNRIFSISISDPQLRGATIRSFNTKSTYLNPSIKNMGLTPLVTGDGASLNDYISRTDQVYNTQLLPNKVFVNVAVGIVSKDMLSETFSTQTMEYDSFYNVTKSTGNFNGEGSKITDITYDNNPSGNYIGRILSSKATLSSGTEIFITEDEYTYNGFLLTRLKKKGNGTDWAIEDMTYDGFGNVTQKATTAPGGAQHSVAMSYDATGRFMINSTDIDGMISSGTYDNSTGNQLTDTNPFGHTTTNSYDTWGKVISSTDYLGKSTVTTYAATALGGTSITRSNDEGNITTSFYNALGQKTGDVTKTVMGGNLATETEYDVYGRLFRQSEPAAQGSASQWNETAYDEYGRVKKTTSFTGKVTNITYSALSTTVNDGTKSVTTTKNAMGHIESLQDPGGTINYSYYANGNMKMANYGGIILSIEQDGWGRKTKLTDPSAGIYEYQYDGWGQLIKEITPKGVTEMSYDNAGKITQKKLTGDETNIQLDYTYDGTTKLMTSLALSNADGNNTTYTYNYDGDKRISSTVEDNVHARFVKGYTYDGFGRINTQSYEAKNKANNTIATKTIEMQYQNGELLQTTLQGTGQILWKVNALDSKGNLTQAMQGTALKNTIQYDGYGFPQQNLLENIAATPTTLMSLGYNYDAQRGLLNSRSNSAFNWSESFSYDSQNRLTAFNDNAGNNSQVYDNRGRITDNSQLGTYAYDGNTYRQSELTLNVGANPYYQNDHPLQQISYNAFKSPVEIIEQGKERISFQYNASLGRSHMYYGDEQADKLLRRYRRHYSEDGGMEITNDLQTGKTCFVFYLGGDAYTAPAIWKEEYSGGAAQAASLYYLHRDHLGSIVMITNDQGAVVEKRQFDAWGNVVKIQDGAGNDLAGFVVLDRGYTSHEHLLGVGLIHMNGRLYDPKLHRFLSPDNFVQDLYNTQNYNRYGYAMNNPLMFTDPSGEFIWAFFAVGALIGALTGGVSYVASAIRTGDWSWSGLGMSMLAGAVIGGVTGGVNPAGLVSSSLGTTFASAFVGGFMPAANFSLGDFNFSISPSIAFGKSFGFGANFSVGYSTGNWSISGGLGFMAYGNYQGFGKAGEEIRASLMGGYNDGTTRFSLSTSWFRGTNDMKEFNQRSTLLVYGHKKFSFGYENDGSPFSYFPKKILSNDTDMYRTNGAFIGVGDYTLNLNMFTGPNGSSSNCENCIDDKAGRSKKGAKLGLWNNPDADKYRLGILSIGHKGFNMGIDSEYVRDAFQNWFAHKIVSPQPGFRMLSKTVAPYAQYRKFNPYTLW
ncbi:RHS repeat-associated protein [Pedobacter sp. AK013]|uniref:polymorphic toxin type 23 domain-containing protein n=1 Tax=Pedobacter sp. AK013 TaxID=2723071 RepID=UPI00161A1795|nr:polymorphic toxin type 23 domain-containing protein [Pedobacter sp. AK013]MBB6237541.1 RHS repeat-associated protein [Pedobacter sp. AK013]